MNALVLTEWFAHHHPHVEVDPERWAGTLPTHQPHELAAALDQWSEQWPTAPRPAEIGALIRQDRAAADAALAELRRQWPRRTAEDRARARMVDDLRTRRPAPPIAPRRSA